jgi:hypothetical protein
MRFFIDSDNRAAAITFPLLRPPAPPLPFGGAPGRSEAQPTNQS